MTGKLHPSTKPSDELLINADLVEDGQTVVLGISGGPDSVCLLYELLALSEERRQGGGAGNLIVCAHMNHGLRGAESDGDEAFVVSLCEKLGTPFEAEYIDAEALARESGLTMEEAGREARYAFFDKVCEKYAGGTDEPPPFVPVIAVAHNQDDQVETILMRILRGTGTDGLAGMAQRRGSAAGFDIVRPLLGVSRGDIDRRLEVYGAVARTDGSNLRTEHFRNRIRLEILPYLEAAAGAGVRQSLLRLAGNAAEDRGYFDAIVEGALDEYLDETDEPSPFVPQLSLPAEMLAGVHPAIRRRLIRAVFAELGLKRDIAAVHLAAAERLLRTWQDGGEASGKRVEFPFDYTFGIEGREAVFRSPGAADPRWKPRRILEKHGSECGNKKEKE